MKIYKSEHLIEVVDKINTIKHIPLSYMSAPEEANAISSIQVSPSYSEDAVEIAMPYSTYDTLDAIFMDKNMQPVPSEKVLHRKDRADNYFFLPTGYIEQNPEQFSYKIKVKKRIEYSGMKDYNIKISCIDRDEDMHLSKKLISIFGDAHSRGVAPNNIFINDGDMDLFSLSSKNIYESDFVFIYTPDGVHYPDKTTKIDFEKFEENNVNIWLLIEEHNLFVDEDDAEIVCVSNIATERPLFKVDKKITPSTNVIIPDGCIDTNYFSGAGYPALHREKVGKNFIVMSHVSAINYISENAKSVYEMILAAHFNGYKTSQKLDSWIHSFLPDYKCDTNGTYSELFGFYEKIDYKSAFGLEVEDIQSTEVDIVSSSKISYSLSGENIEFNKEGGVSEKSESEIHIFTPNRTILSYPKDNALYIHRASPKIVSTKNTDTELSISISKVANCAKGLYIDKITTATVPINKSIETSVSIFFYNIGGQIVPLTYKDDSKKELICIVRTDFTSSKSIELHDIRRLGGGLEESAEPNYNLLDIGSPNGRPYRKGGTLVVSLPRRLEKYKKLIEAEIIEHKVAGTLHIIEYI